MSSTKPRTSAGLSPSAMICPWPFDDCRPCKLGCAGKVVSGFDIARIAPDRIAVRSVPALLARHDVRVQGNVDELAPVVREVLDQHPGPVAQFLAGESKTLGFLVGQVMKRSGGQAVPQVVQELVRAELERRAAGA